MVFFFKKRIEARHGRERRSDFAWQVFRGVVRLGIIGIFIGMTWYVTRIPALTIGEVSIDGGETISHDFIRDQVETEFTGAYLLIVPKRFAYLYPHDRIVEVLEGIPRVHGVTVERTSLKSLHVSFEEYIPYALWCSDNEQVPCWFISESGYSFIEAPILHGGTLVRHIAEGLSEIEEGQVIDVNRLRLIYHFIDRLSNELTLRVASVLYRENGDIEFSISGGGQILVSGNKDFEMTFENLKTVLGSPEFKHLAPGKFQYVDVRFENKVFVNEELQTESMTTATTTPLPD